MSEVLCPQCRRHPIRVRGWCKPCYDDWNARAQQGNPPVEPPLPAWSDEATARRPVITPQARARGVATQMDRAARRREDYAWLRLMGETPEEAARRVGVSKWSAYKYEARLQDAHQGELFDLEEAG